MQVRNIMHSGQRARSLWKIALFCGLLLGWSVPAAAQCSATTLGVAFGTYEPFSGSAVDSTGSIEVSCLVSLGYTVSLSTGSGGSYNPRALSSGGNTLNYNLFLDSARSTIWGDGSSGTSVASGEISVLLFPVSHTVYGRIPGGQNPVVGSYADTITVTVTF